MRTASQTSAKIHTWRRLSRPAGISRPAVRGLRASSSASISRLTAMPKLRAATMATVIQNMRQKPGTSHLGEEGGRVGERQGEDRMLELDQIDEPAGVDEQRHGSASA